MRNIKHISKKELLSRSQINHKDALQTRQGVYLAKGIYADFGNSKEIDVYRHPIKGLCCFSEDFGSEGTGVDDRYDCHVSVQFTGLDFISRIRNLR